MAADAGEPERDAGTGTVQPVEIALAADRVTDVLLVGGAAVAVVLLCVFVVGLVGLTDRLSAAVFSKNRVLLGAGLGGLALLTIGYLVGSPSLMWVGGGLLVLLALFLLAAG